MRDPFGPITSGDWHGLLCAARERVKGRPGRIQKSITAYQRNNMKKTKTADRPASSTEEAFRNHYKVIAPLEGGPAFPTFNPDWKAAHDGMTLRDWFAGQALSGLLGEPRYQRLEGEPLQYPEDYAEVSYVYADAMLRAREASRLTANTEQSEGGVE